MPKLVLTDPTSLSNEASFIAQITSNNTAIEAAVENTLSRDGTTPNQMGADLDMNSNQIINLIAAATDTEPVRKAEFDDLDDRVDVLEDDIATINASVTAAVAAADAAADSEISAGASATAAAASAVSAAASLDAFDDKYLGAKTIAPTVDNDGDPLSDGDLYYNTTSNVLFVYDLGSTTWITATAGVASFEARTGAVTSASGDYTASEITNVAAGGIVATTVQAAIDELDTEKLASSSYTAVDVLTKLLTVDGSGSGLDADLLDGSSSAAFQSVDATLTALAAYNTNGLVTQTAADTFAGRTVTGTANQISVANGDGVAGNPTLSLPSDVVIPTVLTVPNTGLHILDTNATHDLIIAPGSNITADRTLTVTTGDTDMIVNLTAVTDEYVLAYDTGTNTWRGVVAASSGASTALDNLASVAINTALLPGTDDSIALGSVTKRWSDLFLSEGGVINWDNGDLTLTQTGNDLVLAGGGLTVSSLNGGQLAGFRNFLINPDGQINQRLPATNADDTYGHDRWYALTQTGTIAVSTVSDAENGTPRMMRLTQSQAAAQRMGYAQIIEGANCKYLRGKQVTLAGRFRCSAAQAIRIAILEWTGSTDAVVSDVVNDWTSADYTDGAAKFFVDTSYTPSGNIAKTPSAATLTDLDKLTVTLGSTFNNLVVLIWTEGTAAQNVTLDFALQIEQGAVASDREFRPNELELCQRYYEKTFNAAVTPAQNAGYDGAMWGMCAGPSLATNFGVPFAVTKRVAPTITLYNPGVANAQARNSYAGADYTGTGASSSNEHIFRLNATATAGMLAGQDCIINVTAEAEL